MATKTATKHYQEVCEMPKCVCADAQIYIWLRRGLLTNDGKPYIIGTVGTVTVLPTGGVDVLVSFDDTTLPNDPDTGIKLVVTFDNADIVGTVCDPVCVGDCSWLTMIMQLLVGIKGLINRTFGLFDQNTDVVAGSFDIARVPFTVGYRLTDVRISCFTYDINTVATFELKVGATLIASFTGTLAAQRQLIISSPVLAYDALPVLTVSGVTHPVYGTPAKGLVLELIGVLAA